MSKFNIGDHICMIHEDYYLKGVIKNLYPEINTAVIALDDDSRAVVNTDIVKAKITNLDLDHDYHMSNESIPDLEPVEKSEITITPEEFRNIAISVIEKNIKKMPEGKGLLGLTFTFFVSDLHRALFFDAVDND